MPHCALLCLLCPAAPCCAVLRSHAQVAGQDGGDGAHDEGQAGERACIWKQKFGGAAGQLGHCGAPCSAAWAPAMYRVPREPSSVCSAVRTVVDGGRAQHAVLVLLPLSLEAILGAEQDEDEDREAGLCTGWQGGGERGRWSGGAGQDSSQGRTCVAGPGAACAGWARHCRWQQGLLGRRCRGGGGRHEAHGRCIM